MPKPSLILSGAAGVAVVAILFTIMYFQKDTPYNYPGDSTNTEAFQILPPIDAPILTPNTPLVRITNLPTEEAFGTIDSAQTFVNSAGLPSAKGYFLGTSTAKQTDTTFVYKFVDPLPEIPTTFPVYKYTKESTLVPAFAAEEEKLPVRFDNITTPTPKEFSLRAIIGDIPYDINITGERMSFSQDYDHVRLRSCPEQNCIYEAITEQNRIPDDKMITIAAHMLGILGVDYSEMDTPYVEKTWGKRDTDDHYIHEQIAVVFPVNLGGMALSTTQDKTIGISVSIDQRDHSVTNIQVPQYHLDASLYKTHTQASLQEALQIRDTASTPKHTIHIPLRNPRIQLRELRTDYYTPATILPVMVWDVLPKEVRGGYFYDSEVIMPLIQNISL